MPGPVKITTGSYGLDGTYVNATLSVFQNLQVQQWNLFINGDGTVFIKNGATK